MKKPSPGKAGGFLFVSRQRRLGGGANAAPQFLGHRRVADQSHSLS